MKQIRKGVFETNSSSTHSVTLEGSMWAGDFNYNPIQAFLVFPDYGGQELSTREDKLGFIAACMACRILEPYNMGWWERETISENLGYIVKTLENSFPFLWLAEIVRERTSFPFSMQLRKNKFGWEYDYYELFGNPFMNEDNDILSDIVESFKNKKEFEKIINDVVFNDGYKIVCNYMSW